MLTKVRVYEIILVPEPKSAVFLYQNIYDKKAAL